MITVKVREPKPWNDGLKDDEGSVYMDVTPGMELRTTKVMDRVGELGRITQEAALSVGLPGTVRNRAIMEHFDPDSLEEETTNMSVEIRQRGELQSLTQAEVSAFAPREGYETEFYGDDWLQDIDTLKNQDLELGDFPWTRAAILSAWGDGLPAGRPTPFVLPGLCEYGGWYGDGEVSLRDLRLWFNIGQLLKEIFCAVGWTFVCPHLDQGDGRYWYGYLSGLRWHRYRGKKAEQFVELSASGIDRNGDPFEALPWVVVQDDENRWGPVGNSVEPIYTYFHDSAISDVALLSIEIQANVTLPVGPNNETARFYVEIVETTNAGVAEGVTVFRSNYQGGVLGPVTLEINEEFYFERELTEGTDVRGYEVFFYYSDTTVPVPYRLNSSSVIFRPDPRHYIEGEQVTIADLLDPEITGKDLLEAVAHLVNGKLVTDQGRKEVTMHVPFSYERVTDSLKIEGFFKRELGPLDFRDSTVPDSVAWSTGGQSRSRFRVYDFNDGEDAYVELRGRQRFKRRVDRGENNNEQTESENPLFEPTLNRFVQAADVGGTGANMPMLWVDDMGNISHEIAARIAVWYGEIGQGNNSFLLDGLARFDIPFLSMLPDFPLADGSEAENLTFTGYANDLYNRHYRREDQQEGKGKSITVLLTGGDETYDAIDFRRTLLIDAGNATWEVQPTAVRDHPRGSDVAVLVEARIVKC